ncbi:cyclin N-terminal domain-containing protein 1 [Tachysurus fulvidraco]|uniref:cyclin N-terminal domain-containing protein 1 n=1 Tax=Tachysurus fulvidraco TaxID=1234273 RepID=UPI001FEDAFFA|nr:cyclin N-terminal domain-containing protein 1 [Tachysurus fulvidraco]
MNNSKLKSLPVKRQTSTSNLKFGEASVELLSDFLCTLNNQNKSNLDKVSSVCGTFKDRRVVEHAFLICEEFQLDHLVAYNAIEILARFMQKHIEKLFSQQKSEVCDGSVCEAKGNYEELVFQRLREKLCLFIISSMQIASKVTLHTNVIDNRSALRYLRLVGSDCPKEKILESELLILKTLDFRVNVPNPLSFAETLLEVLGHNDPTTPVVHLHHLCRYVLQYVYLQRESIYGSLLMAVTGCLSPSPDQRAKFVSVTEDCMLLGVGVIAVAAFIHQTSAWEKVVEELALITGISAKSIMDFVHVTLMHVTKNKVK